ncbi:MAG: C4-dicarboxylate ABC transporter substrate-binding protein [Burkholderiales bacterium]|nr:C4-dicarboxylate ABC transporter substrate-binding protein [Burkholderiales bacterium]
MPSRPVAELARLQHALRRELWLTLGLAIVLVVGAFVLALRFVQPAPPRSLVMTTGQEDGGYHAFGCRYQSILARDGVSIELRSSAGSLENVARLTDPESDVDVGFLQAGTAFAVNAPELVSLGSLYYEPLWVFYRGPAIEDLDGLRGRKIAIGPNFSGVRALALQLLAVNDAVLPPTELLELDGNEAAQALARGDIGAALFVAPADSPAVMQLMATRGVRLLDFVRAEAYTRRFPYLTRLVLPRGAVDFVQDVPARDIVLIAPTANLLARRDLHPALAYLLMRAASELHAEAGMFNVRGEFPSNKNADFPLSAEASRYYTAGPPFLQRYMPFWAANLVDRMWVMILPLLAVLVPLARIVPALYSWRVRSRIYRWYARLKEIELQLEEKRSGEELRDMHVRLDSIEEAVNHIPTPLAFSANLYSFRQHIDLVRARLRRRMDG